ncbi:adenylosuccinate lyase family protein [Rhodobacteraceae bacterium F11138]|nr:adenylosuccinate lyase family protein [Rhodobacteraceae bacterium F11138]
MAASMFESALYARLFPTGDVGRLFTDSAEIRAMLLVEGALARVQGASGLIPPDSAAAIARAAHEVQIDGAGLAPATGANGVSVPALVTALRDAMQAPEHAQFVHWGATSQDIIDTALMLRLRQALTLIETDLQDTLATLAGLAETHAERPMAARTYGQHATPTSFGALAAAWGMPLLNLLAELPGLRDSCLLVSLSGAAGTASELGPQPARLRSELALALNLHDPGHGWHTDRTPLLRIADWLTRLTLALGKLGEDTSQMMQSGIAEITLTGAGGSSTMPQKQNPVAPSVLVALARQTTGQLATLQGAGMPRNQRDGAAWFTEWLCLPQIVLGAAAASRTAMSLCADITPQAEPMSHGLTQGLGLIHAEALSFVLATQMPRPKAQAAVKTLCRQALDGGIPLAELAAQAYPDLDIAALFDPARQMGQAPAQARDFAHRVARDLPPRS